MAFSRGAVTGKALLLFALLLAMALAYAAAGPYRTVANIKGAIVANNPTQLHENVDFAALRLNLKRRLHQHLGTLPGGDSGLANLASGFGGWVVDGMVDTLVTPAGLAALMEGRSYLMPNTEGRNSTDELLQNAQYRYDSTSQFSVWVPDGAGDGTRFILQRRGLDWQLVDIQLSPR